MKLEKEPHSISSYGQEVETSLSEENTEHLLAYSNL